LKAISKGSDVCELRFKALVLGCVYDVLEQATGVARNLRIRSSNSLYDSAQSCHNFYRYTSGKALLSITKQLLGSMDEEGLSDMDSAKEVSQ
jgi:hypothetical protein